VGHHSKEARTAVCAVVDSIGLQEERSHSSDDKERRGGKAGRERIGRCTYEASERSPSGGRSRLPHHKKRNERKGRHRSVYLSQPSRPSPFVTPFSPIINIAVISHSSFCSPSPSFPLSTLSTCICCAYVVVCAVRSKSPSLRGDRHYSHTLPNSQAGTQTPREESEATLLFPAALRSVFCVSAALRVRRRPTQSSLLLFSLICASPAALTHSASTASLPHPHPRGSNVYLRVRRRVDTHTHTHSYVE
jgi:hypothetical protein